MFVAIDAGNTNVQFGVAPDVSAPWRAISRYSSDQDRTADEWYALLRPHVDLDSGGRHSVAMCSVVPAITRHLKELMTGRFAASVLTVGPDLDLGIEIATDQPHETGADRIVNAVATRRMFGVPAIIVDLGTATKVDALDRHGRFLGGAIAPGLAMGVEALASRAARLYSVPLELPSSAIGRNTVHAVQAGAMLGHLKMILGLVSEVAKELGGVDHCILTGGFAGNFAGKSSIFTAYEPNLTLEGLRIIAQRNP